MQNHEPFPPCREDLAPACAQSPFKCFATGTTHPLSKLKRSVLLVMKDG